MHYFGRLPGVPGCWAMSVKDGPSIESDILPQEGEGARPWLLRLLRLLRLHVSGASLGLWASQLLLLARAPGTVQSTDSCASDGYKHVWVQEGEEARPWLLRLLRQHVCGASLGFWASQLLPLARALGNKASAVATSDQLLSLQCASLEAQVWDTLPAFADGALDLADAFRQACCCCQGVMQACIGPHAVAAADQLLSLQCASLEAQVWDTLPAFTGGALDLADAFR